jgi:DNA polymerase-1
LIDGRHLKVRADKPYVGFNALIQGSCAVVLKQALVDLDNSGLGQFAVLPVHDEIMFDVPIDRVDEVVPEITRVMTRIDFRAPLTVGTKIVSRWGDAYRKAA